MKKTQAQLKAEYLTELENTSTWRDSKHMQEYIYKKTAFLVELHDWGMLEIEKPTIETKFCFWYHDSPYDTNDYDRANDAENYARTHEDYFINENLEGLNRSIENIKEALNSENLRTKHCNNYYILKHHWNWDSENCKIRGFDVLDKYEEKGEKARQQMNGNDLELMTREDLENWLEWLETVKAQFTKRLNTYLKRYWLSKLHTWTYWADA